jgi:Holliday junction DNA helicase RuvA
MIAHLRGRLLSKHPNQAVVETAGVGYDVTITVSTFSDLPAAGNEVALHIHTHVREDQIALYGFLRPAEKQLFEKLITVSGIGPKLAVTILSGMAAGVATAPASTMSAMEEDVLSALVNLGYQRAAGEKALAGVLKNGGLSFDAIFRQALALLSK